ncbi:hypothetical protein CAEBREN_17636 [Caenorhabditis brenneri]|uniref:Uncharacterized protein n=1 Tax=Caenorhabditis brenneri TaxID=135651 RepID=G0N567_CAEBE|nr:hypothetical protein CAEBREN_17636 [Caenorhabditis brenneri]
MIITFDYPNILLASRLLLNYPNKTLLELLRQKKSPRGNQERGVGFEIFNPKIRAFQKCCKNSYHTSIFLTFLGPASLIFELKKKDLMVDEWMLFPPFLHN